MSVLLRVENKFSFLLVLLLALGFGWLLYGFVEAETVSLKDSPPPMPTII